MLNLSPCQQRWRIQPKPNVSTNFRKRAEVGFKSAFECICTAAIGMIHELISDNFKLVCQQLDLL
jgi:hypothetical protein